MKIDSNMLSKIATVLDKTAAYIEQQKSATVREQQEKRAQEAKRLADKLSSLTGEDLESELTEKLAEVDPRIAKVLDRIAGEEAGVESMGGPDTAKEKLAAHSKSANESFIEWVTGP